ncbi:MAG: NADP-dependent oxidoreductase [SAR86 cluster bacterium]|jgi:NADPH:quinone reductase|nr:NADP-dependent oxidoreductase [SAR86 cluster bacterium]|tara:strand:- start:905 stop:1843 length:939 start_codon:yes stop_codon:yes gene_type:complete
MKAVGIMEHGGPEVLEVIEVPEVKAGPGQMRIRNYAAAVNPTDIVVRNGMLAELQKKNPPPYVPGMDAAGIVDQIGEGVETDIKVGDKVMAMVVPRGNYGAYREQIILDQNAVVRAPKDTTYIEACTLPMNALTARLSLDLLSLKEGQVLAVTGSPGAYGGYVVELAKADGLIVIADSSESDEELLKSLGVDLIIPRGEGYAEKIRQEFPNGVDGIADGALLNELAIDAVKDGGSFTSVRGFQGKPQRDIEFTATWVTTYDCRIDLLDTLRQQAEDGILTLRVADSVSSNNASEAHERLEAGGTRGRMVIEF